jgi:hypothetical protein
MPEPTPEEELVQQADDPGIEAKRAEGRRHLEAVN